MEITNVNISLKNTEGTLRAYASITFDDEFVVKLFHCLISFLIFIVFDDGFV